MKPGLATVVGGGLAGGLISTMLARAGWTVTLFERRSDPRKSTLESSRAINLALSTRGLRALSQVGLKSLVLEHCVPMLGRQIHCPGEDNRFIQYSSNPDNAIYSIQRDVLNRLLIDKAAQSPDIEIQFNAQCIEIEPKEGLASFEIEGTTLPDVKSDLILGADGLGSVVREVIAANEPGCSVKLSTFSHGYKELTISAAAAQKAELRTDALHVWPRGTALIVALPNPDQSFNCTLFWNLKGTESFSSRDNPVDLREALQRDYPDLIPLLSDLEAQYSGVPSNPLRSLSCSAWETEGKILIIGDAAHAQLPFFGQGMNTAFEDCLILSQLLKERETLGEALQTFARTRKPDTDAIAMLSERNFRELSQEVADPNFRFSERPAGQARRSGARTLYEEVTFTNKPYSEITRDFGITGSD